MADLPPYRPSAPSPVYSAAASSTERILQHTPLPGRSQPTGTFVRNAHNMTVIIDGQKENSPLPSFGRAALLSGILLLEAFETVAAVNSKFEGVVEFLSLSHGFSRLKVVDEARSLYAKDGSHTRCPPSIPFAWRFPSTFENNGNHHPIPPSCDIPFPGGSFLRCTYSLTFSVSVALHRSVPFLAKERRLEDLTGARKFNDQNELASQSNWNIDNGTMCPEEWFQLPVELATGAGSRPPAVYCDLFVPSIGVFGTSETVPFHLQFSGSRHSLQNIFANQEQNSIIRVYLLRQITVDPIGEKINTILGEGSLRPLPPLFGLPASTSHDALNWEGEVRLPDITTVTFDIGTLSVMYLLAVELSPAGKASSKRAHYGFPIKVTTDTWVGSAERQD
ncbi:hypothetical protein C8R47DRAFT_1066158 [Mycena vitilis]|nr:hypothetical protein C8R47DRAFT_1066158 [Mycena vitilis]